ncbi:MAG TPA: arylsulfatase [Vicinamibacterales bacterium]
MTKALLSFIPMAAAAVVIGWLVRSAPPIASDSPPNILLILLDDAGYGQTGTFGGLIPTPAIDALAANGLRFTRFHVTALCSPTRAALLTGRNNHAVGMGTITNWSTDDPGYTASIPKSAAMVSEILRQHGYATASFGKWHLIPDPETTPAGPFDHWPTRQGFDYFYGFLGGETDQWHPEVVENTVPARMVPSPGREDDYTLTEELATRARLWLMRQKSMAPDRPVFMYFAPGAVHAPLQAPRRWIEPFAGKFDMGWDEYRRIVFARQKQLGVIPADTVLTARPPEIPAWNSLDADRKRLAARLMEVFAGFMNQVDHEVGRVVDAFRETGQIDNTLIVLIAGDNGASFEGSLDGTDNIMKLVNGVQGPPAEVLRHLDEIGGPLSNPHYPVGWAWAGNTPFQWGKRFGSHLGGTRDPMVISWPARIRDAGSTRPQYEHIIDIFPTILEAAGIAQPRAVNGIDQQVVDGVSFLDVLASPSAPERHTKQYFEMHGNRSMYDSGWIAAKRSGVLPWVPPQPTASDPPWELYDLAHDYSESRDLATANPGKLEQLKKEFDEAAIKNKVLPINPSFDRAHTNPPPPGGRAFYTFYPGTVQLFDAMAPGTRNRTHTITAYVDIPAGGANGVLVADGGTSSGYVLYLEDGRPSYTYNYFRREVTTVTAPDRLPPGRARIDLRFAYDGGGIGKGATVTLTVNGRTGTSARLARTVPKIYSYDESFDVGEDTATAVGPYTAPFPFTGTIEKIEIRADPPAK